MVRGVTRALLLAAWCASTCDAHGFITTPVSRNTVVCDKLWPDYLKASKRRGDRYYVANESKRVAPVVTSATFSQRPPTQ